MVVDVLVLMNVLSLSLAGKYELFMPEFWLFQLKPVVI